jgi:thermopsin
MLRHSALWSIVATAIMVIGVLAGFAPGASAHVTPVTSNLPHSSSAKGAASSLSSPTVAGAPIVIPNEAQRLAQEKATLAAQKASGKSNRDFYPPNYLGGGTVKNGVVSPITAQSPNPIGIGDFGVNDTTGTPVGSVSNSPSWEATVTISSANVFYLDNDGPDVFGGQLNTVTDNATTWSTINGVYWVQNVFFYEPSTGEFIMIDNIWNFSSTSAAEPSQTFADNGPGGAVYGGEYYENELIVAPGLPGPSVSMPFTLHLWNNATTTNFTGLPVNGHPSAWGQTDEDSNITFGYQLISSTGATIAANPAWDYADVNSTTAPSPTVPAPSYQVNGVHLTPNNFLLWDSEIMLGGPGGGSTVSFNAFNGTMSLQSWDQTAGAYINAPTVWDTATDTGETAEGIAEHYTQTGQMILEGGPSIIEPMWGATPGPGAGGSNGNIGTLTLTGTLSPDNTFIFVNPGGTLNRNDVNWAPTLPGGSYTYHLPPGAYSGDALMSNYDPALLGWSGASSTTSTVPIALTADPAQGIYTPLYAWNNFQLGNISSSGAGTAGNPYVITGIQVQDIWQEFGELNDYLYPVFPGVQIVGTTDTAIIAGLPPLTMVYPSIYDGFLTADGFPLDNDLQIELYGTNGVSLVDNTQIGGWMSIYQFSGYLPTSEVVLWNAENSIIEGNTFLTQGTGLILMDGDTSSTTTANVVEDNTFTVGITPYNGFSYTTGLIEYESGDVIVNNWFNTYVGASSPSYNEWSGFGQTNLDAWNLASPQPSGLGGAASIAGLPWVCGNWWGGATPYQSSTSGAWVSTGNPTSAVPFTDTDAATKTSIATGGDSCPTGPFGMETFPVVYSETGLTSGTWSITDGSQTISAAAGSPITVQDPNGSWAYSVASEAGYTASPASGSNTMAGVPLAVAVTFTPYVQPVYEVSLSEVGLPAGTTWSFTWESGTVTVNTSQASTTVPDGTYTYTVNAVADYTIVSGGSGSVTVNGASVSVWVVFAPNPGTVSLTVTPASASVWINGVAVSGTAGVFSSSSAPGIASVEITATGYVPYFTNLTVSAGTTTSKAITLAVVPTTVVTKTVYDNTTITVTQNIYHNGTLYNNQTSSSLASTGGYEGLGIGAVIGIVLGLLVGMLLFKRKKEGSGTMSGGSSDWSSSSDKSAPGVGSNTGSSDDKS